MDTKIVVEREPFEKNGKVLRQSHSEPSARSLQALYEPHEPITILISFVIFLLLIGGIVFAICNIAFVTDTVATFCNVAVIKMSALRAKKFAVFITIFHQSASLKSSMWICSCPATPYSKYRPFSSVNRS